MIIDVEGLPKEIGATDKMDSSRLAGMMALCNHPLTPDLSKYIVLNDQGVRHPTEFPANNPKNFSRDQLLCLLAGLYKQGRIDICIKLHDAAKARGWWAQNIEDDVPGSTKRFADWLAFGNRLVLAKAAGKRGNILGYPWLVLAILFNAIFTPIKESNQLLGQLFIMGPRWMKFYKLVTPKWQQALRDYWSGWRGEPELAEMLINKLDN